MKKWLILGFLLFLASPCLAVTTISRVGSCNGTTSCTPPAHQPGDFFVGYAFRNNSNTPPTNPAGWVTLHNTSGTGTASDLLSCKIATTSAETATGFTNATGFILLVYRGVNINATFDCSSFGMGSVFAQNAGSPTISYGTFTLTDTGGTSWVIGCGGSVSATDVGTAPSGMMNVTTASTNHVGCHDTNAPVSAWAGANVTVNADAAWQSAVFEIRACLIPSCLRTISSGFVSGSSGTVTAVSPHTAGNKLLAIIGNSTTGTNVSTVANTAGDTWALCASSRQSTIRHTEIWSTTSNPVGNASDTVTVTFAVNDTNKFVAVFEVSGLITGGCEGSGIANCSVCMTVASSTFSPAAPGNFNVAIGNTTNAATYTASSGYSMTLNTATGAEQQANAASGSQTAGFTLALNNNIGMSVGSFKAVSGGAGQQIGGFLVGP